MQAAQNSLKCTINKSIKILRLYTHNNFKINQRRKIFYMACYTRCIVATTIVHVHSNNTKFYKGFKAIKNTDSALIITACDPFAFKILIN